jgi:hypothetical protein
MVHFLHRHPVGLGPADVGEPGKMRATGRMTILSLLALIAMLGAAVRYARDRSRNSMGPSDQLRRILYSTFAYTGCFAVYLFLVLLALASPAQLLMDSIENFLFNALISLIVISAADIGFKAMGAQRTRAWLFAGIAVFSIPLVVTLILAATVFNMRFTLVIFFAVVAQIVVTIVAALVWWSFLPLQRPVAEVFE